MVYFDFSQAFDTLTRSLSLNWWKFADNTKLRQYAVPEGCSSKELGQGREIE